MTEASVMRRGAWVCAVALLVALSGGPALAAEGELNLLPNPSFESGAAAPEHWSAFGTGRWDFGGHGGERCVSVTGAGDDATWWQADSAPVERGKLYHVSYWVKRAAQATDGTTIAGLTVVNHDAPAGPDWEQRSYYFRAPDAMAWTFFRVGEWHVKGEVYLDDVVLRPAVRAYERPAGLGLPLGDGEVVDDGQYTATHRMGGAGSTDFRGLQRSTAEFNTDRWVFSKPAEVVYRHEVGRLRQSESQVELSVGYYVRGKLFVEASADGSKWAPMGEISKAERVSLPVPSPLLPARALWVSLRTTEDCDLQVNGYSYRCRLREAQSVRGAVGRTQYLEVLRESPALEVELAEFAPTGPRGTEVEALLKSPEARRAVNVTLRVESPGGKSVQQTERAPVAPGAQKRVRVAVQPEGAGSQTVWLSCAEAESGAVLWEGRGEFVVSPLEDAAGGELLSENPELAVWWCEPERKVSKTRPAPKAKGRAVRMSAAANEYEPAQLVLTPRAEVRDCRVSVGDLMADSGAIIPASEISVRMVEYVPVAQPTDELGTPGDWPDPLPLHERPISLTAGRNYPFWITVHVPAGTKPGDYQGGIKIEGAALSQRISLSLHVWGFELPEQSHVRSGFGLSNYEIARYHNLTTPEETRQVFELYLRNFASHRIAPYTFGRGIQVGWQRGADGKAAPKLNFSGFDEDAHHALDELGFNAFSLSLEGMGGGTFYERELGQIAGYQQGTPEYEAAFDAYAGAVQKHLEERGWLKKAYVYWFDEPDRKDFPFVRGGMELIHRAAPKLKRLLTTHPAPELYGEVDLWCLPTYTLDPEVVKQRQAAGEEVWWYLCTGPKAPYFTLFLDHYGTEIRVWLWETWKYGLNGILVWDTTYWTSGAAYPGGKVQNPWQDPMSWTSGYGTPAGQKQPWGNGDGRFLYPPNRDPGMDKTRYLEGPVPSIRWELLREGVEDFEYLWLLRSEVERLKQSGVDPASYREAEGLLEVPADICTDTSHFTTTPEPIHRHRERVARAIEGLRAR
jgi:hypothetical protein